MMVRSEDNNMPQSFGRILQCVVMYSCVTNHLNSVTMNKSVFLLLSLIVLWADRAPLSPVSCGFSKTMAGAGVILRLPHSKCAGGCGLLAETSAEFLG